MSERLRVGISEFRVATPPAVLISYGLGSCLAIALYDPQLRVGALAHTLLPSARPGWSERQTKFVDSATRLMVAQLVEQGAQPQQLVAKLAGGANMFSAIGLSPDSGIGLRNLQTARQVLAELGIPVVAEDVGGTSGRTVEFDLASGRLLVRSVHGPAHLEL